MKIAFVFPGQGSQCVGMGADAAALHPAAAEKMDAVDGIVGYGLKGFCFDGPEDELKKTENTQPALYAASAATLEILRANGIEPFAVAGHSLGEYTALYAANVFSFEDGLRLVRTRGEAFARAGAARPGAMAAIIGLEGPVVASLCTRASNDQQVAVAANFNDPTQTVISGDPAAVERACELAKEAKAKRALPLPVSGAFHSPLVAPAADTMRSALDEVPMASPTCNFVNNVSAGVVSDPSSIREGLVAQVTSSVRWVECVQKLVELGTEAFVEVGSGKVLAGLIRRINKDIPTYTTESRDSIEAALAALKG